MKHPSAVCEAVSVGRDCRMEANSFVGAEAQLGDGCVVQVGASIDGLAKLGARVRVGAGARVRGEAMLDDEVQIDAGGCVGAYEPDSRSTMQRPTRLAAGVFVGANAVVMSGVSIGRHALIEANTVVRSDVPPFAIVRGNPAAIDGYRSTMQPPPPMPVSASGTAPHVLGVSWHKLPLIEDMRGDLVVAQFNKNLPFVPRRTFIVHNVPSARIRGEHAHRECHQLLVCVTGSVHVLTDDGQRRQEFRLDTPSLGLHLAPYVWGTQYNFSPGSALLVFASHDYAADDYIRIYDEFLTEAAARTPRA